jgi:hypothetical protein
MFNNNNIYFIELKHTLQIASQYKETVQLDNMRRHYLPMHYAPKSKLKIAVTCLY